MWLVCVHTLHLQAMPSQFFMILSDVFKFSQDFMWGRREFQIFGPKDLMLLLPKLTWLTLGISRLSLYGLRTILLLTLNWPGRRLGNRRNHGNHGNSSWTRELQILAIKIRKEKHKSKFDKVWEKKL